MTIMEDYFQDTIRLQLKKPKKWNWELSTSKSSPHIQLPIIQLYDAKGNLLVEAKDNGGTTERRSWHSSHVFPFKELPTNVSVGFKESTTRHLQRCKSDTLDLNVTGRNNVLRNKKRHNSTIQYNNNTKFDNKFVPSSSTSIIEKLITDKCLADGLNENSRRKQLDDSKVSNGKLTRNLHHLQKSRSELYNKPKSDDLFERKLKYNDIPSLDTIPNDDNSYDNGENFRAYKTRYKTRTCSAGTLIITEESFNNSHRQRRRRRKQYETDTNTTRTTTTTTNLNETIPALQRNKFVSHNRRMDKTINTFHNRQTSDPIGLKFDCNRERQPNVDKFNKMDKQPTERKEQHYSGLFYSLSNVFPFERLLNNTKNEDNVTAEEEENCNYIVQEPTTTPNESRKNSESIIIKEKTKKKKYRKVCRQYSDGTTTSSSSSGVATLERRKYGRTRSHLIKDHPHHHQHHRQQSNSKGHQNGETDLLHQLVKRLSSSNNNNNSTTTTTASGDHVKMGANVSRHSAKGLSGRRSQSSGSICNGKGGRHNNDGKICSSLPSYLDERDTQNGCNNNHHECEKPPLDEVERIPPLGDGAPLHWKFSDNQTVLCDQGYGSERSPEEEYPPPLPDHDIQCHHHLEPHACYPFVTPESTFIVKLTKGSRGLGLSVTGGIDSNGSWPGLIRIKRLFPHQPASACGLLNVGDLLLEANGITLTGLTNYEALEVLRTAPNQVDLKVCRPPPDVCVSPVSTEVPPPPPRREPPTSLNLTTAAYSTPEDDYYHGEFEVTLTKIQGSLGFTLRKEDDSALGHYVRALVREPALTDGRIRPGDKIIAVNDVEISSMSHEQAVQFLRQCGDIVKLLLYRDSAQTPVAALSPTETTPRTSFSKKPHLRQEAVDMLNDIAVRKLIPGNQDNNNTYRRSLSPNASPRRLRRQPCPSDASTTQITTTQDPTTTTKYMLINDNEQFHEGLLQKCSAQHPYDDDAFNSLFSIESDDGDKPSRPSSLDLYNPNQTPVATRKPRFNFSLAHNAYELNNLDPEVLDAPNLKYNLGNDDVKCADVECGDNSSFPQEPASMPHIPIDNNKTFSHKNPAYQSAHPQFSGVGGGNNEEKTNNNASISSKMNNHDEKQTTTTTTTATTTSTNTLKKSKSSIKKESSSSSSSEKPTKSQTNLQCMKMQEEYEILAIELNRGWNSRLGFSLQGAAGVTYVSAVHADSVAAKDGRLKPGDRVIKVNDESVEHMNTSEIIDLLRIVRGPVCIVVSRIKSNEDCPKSNAAN